MGFNLGGALKTGMSVMKTAGNVMGAVNTAMGVVGAVKKLANAFKSPSTLANLIRNTLIDANTEKISVSEFYLTNTTNNEDIQLCLPPDKISIKTGANFRNYSVVELGEIKLPKGNRLESISWSGILPGPHILHQSKLIKLEAFDKADEIAVTLNRWQEEGSKIKLLITQTPLANLEVYLKDFSFEASGGNGDLKYSISLISAKDLEILTVEEADKRREERAKLKSRPPRKKSTLGKQLKNLNDIASVVSFVSGGAGTLGGAIGAVASLTGFDIEKSPITSFATKIIR